MLALIVSFSFRHDGRGALPFPAMLLSGKAEIKRASAPSRNERRAGKNARQGAQAQYVAVEEPLRIAGSAPQPFQTPTLHPMGCAHLQPSDEI
jgi:hypothetical protein